MVQRVLDFQRPAPPEERFDGIHFDIEPHALEAWNDATRVSLSRLFLDRSKEWVAMAREAGLPAGAAIPFWYDGFDLEWEGRKKPMNAHVQDLFDYVALMDYRNRAEGRDGIIAHAEKEIAYGRARGKRVVIGLETGDSEPSKITFHSRGAKALGEEMAATERAFAREAGFGGFAIHHLRAWMDLVLREPDPSAPALGRP